MACNASPSLSPTRRRELARQVRDGFPPMGVYAVHNLAAGTVRVFASTNVPGAINRLRFELRMRNHRDAALQRAWDEHGGQGVRIEEVERVRQRSDPAFDHAAELRTLHALWSQELSAEPTR